MLSSLGGDAATMGIIVVVMFALLAGAILLLWKRGRARRKAAKVL